MTLLVPLGLACVVPHDPLLLQADFPWVVLLPLLIGAQHGALAAAVSSALLAGLGALHLELRGPGSFEALGVFAAGCLCAGTIAGAARDRITAQLGRLAERASEDSRRLARLARAHAVLSLSHRKLEERLAARSWSLQGAFEDARRSLAGASSVSELGGVVLGVLSNHAQVQSATLLTFGAARGTRQPPLAVSATLGNPPAADPGHRLVRRALETRGLVALDAENADGSDETILAVAPLCTASGRLLGLVLIHELPFMAFQAEGLNALAALTALLADLLEDQFVDSQSSAELDALFSSAPPSEHELHTFPAADLLEEEPLEETRTLDGSEGSGVIDTRTGTHRRRVAQSA
jgi:hypothetical protein